MSNDMREYKAIIWIADNPGKRVTMFANDLGEARNILEQLYGKGTVFDLHNEEDAEKPRG